MRLIDADEIKIQVKRQYEDCHGYSGNKKAIYREAILAVRSILHSAKTIDAVLVVRCRDCKHYDTADFDGNILCGCTLHSAMVDITPDSFCSYGEKEGTK